MIWSTAALTTKANFPGLCPPMPMPLFFVWREESILEWNSSFAILAEVTMRRTWATMGTRKAATLPRELI